MLGGTENASVGKMSSTWEMASGAATAAPVLPNIEVESLAQEPPCTSTRRARESATSSQKTSGETATEQEEHMYPARTPRSVCQRLWRDHRTIGCVRERLAAGTRVIWPGVGRGGTQGRNVQISIRASQIRASTVTKLEAFQVSSNKLINRPGVARAVLQTDLSLVNGLIN